MRIDQKQRGDFASPARDVMTFQTTIEVFRERETGGTDVKTEKSLENVEIRLYLWRCGGSNHHD